MSIPFYSSIENDLDNYWYPRVFGVYGREEPFIVTDIALDETPSGDEIVNLIGTFITDGIKREIGVYPEEFELEEMHRSGVRGYRLVKREDQTESVQVRDLILRWGDKTLRGEPFTIQILIDGNESFFAHNFYWSGVSGDWVVLKGHNDIRNEHYMYIPGDTWVKTYKNEEGVYIVHFDQIYTH